MSEQPVDETGDAPAVEPWEAPPRVSATAVQSGQVAMSQVVIDRSRMGDNDVAIWTMHWRGATPGAPDASADMNEEARDDATSKIVTYWNAVKAYIDNSLELREVRWYSVPPARGDYGDAIDVIPVNVLGGRGIGLQAPQVAVVTNLITSSRKTWGRFFVPAAGLSMNSTDGQIESPEITIFADAAATLCRRGTLEGNTPCVLSRKEWSYYDIDKIRVGSNPATIRTRRPEYHARTQERDIG